MPSPDVFHQRSASHGLAELSGDVRTPGRIEQAIAQPLHLPRRFVGDVLDVTDFFDASVQVGLHLIEHRTRWIARLPSEGHTYLLSVPSQPRALRRARRHGRV